MTAGVERSIGEYKVENHEKQQQKKQSSRREALNVSSTEDIKQSTFKSLRQQKTKQNKAASI